MPVFALYIKCDLENIGKISLDLSTHRFAMRVKEAAGAEERERVYVTATEEMELSGSKGTANFAMKFAKDSRKEATINVHPIKGFLRDYIEEDNGKFVPIAAFDCRGIEPVEFYPEDGWLVESTAGKKFTDVDLSDKEWCEFDDKGDQSVGIYEFESKFELHRGS